MEQKAKLWKEGSFYNDGWAHYDGGNASDSQDLIITLDEWKEGDWANHSGKLGLSVQSSDELKEIVEIVQKFDLIVVNFPGFADGTAFSVARSIRDGFGFKGEIRAAGAYILDQMPMLLRCGVDSFEISSEAVRTGLERDAWPDIPMYYQHALDGEDNLAKTRAVDIKRPWISKSVTAEENVLRVA